MKRYIVTYTQYWVYHVEAEDYEDAENKAGVLFDQEMHRPIAHSFYDEIEVEIEGPDEEDEDPAGDEE